MKSRRSHDRLEDLLLMERIRELTQPRATRRKKRRPADRKNLGAPTIPVSDSRLDASTPSPSRDEGRLSTPPGGGS